MPPTPPARPLALRVTPAAERSLRQGHPWLFEQAIVRQSHQGQPGDLAVVFDRKGRFLAVGLFDPLSTIRVRILQQGQPASIDRDWLAARMAAAAELRAFLPAHNTTGYRLVHGENDGLPGLVIDRYGSTLALKLYTAAWVPWLEDVLAALQPVAPAERLVLRLSRAVQQEPQHLHGLRDGQVITGPPLAGPVLFQENGLRFEADLLRGQKTGFFLDQRDNRARVEELAKGRRVLNAFAYTGGFSVYAARGGASSLISLDTSRPALEAALRNFTHNRDHAAVAAARHQVLVADAFQALGEFGQSGRRFDLVILDPPAFAHRSDQERQALAAYRRLTHLALAVLEPGGILVQASCSSRVSAEHFFVAVYEASRHTGRPLQEIERTGHPIDHPVGFPEGIYLKCLLARAP